VKWFFCEVKGREARDKYIKELLKRGWTVRVKGRKVFFR